MSATQFHDFDGSVPAPLMESDEITQPHRRFALSLFWRTFFLLTLLLLGSLLGWLQTLSAIESEGRAMETAQEVASQVKLSRAALLSSDPIARVSLMKSMQQDGGLRIVAREPTDRFTPLEADETGIKVLLELQRRLGAGTMVAKAVNGQPGMWIGFTIEADHYWLMADQETIIPPGGKTWLIWLSVAAALSLSGAVVIARLINRPLKELSFAASRVREGRFEASRLDESVPTSEIRDVNIGFNRMAQKLAKVEQDRAVMLAGISHDLRTPLARLRLETEMSVIDIEARAHMVADIAQLDAIIDKFLDYARPTRGPLGTVVLADVMVACAYAFQDKPDVQLKWHLEPNLLVRADEVELGRIISNLMENARRYGKSVDTGVAIIEIAAVSRDNWVLVKIRDHGLGVAPDQLINLTQPFYRGEAARTAANGAGLGLAIVDKTVRRMGGAFAITNATSGGLSANIRLQRGTRV